MCLNGECLPAPQSPLEGFMLKGSRDSQCVSGGGLSPGLAPAEEFLTLMGGCLQLLQRSG